MISAQRGPVASVALVAMSNGQASDAHDDKYRKPILSEARDAVSRSFGGDFAQASVLENPAAIIAGLPLPSSRKPSIDTSQKFLGKIG